MARICIEPDCKTHASFNDEDKKGGLYCSKHKKDGMIDKVSKKCKICKTKCPSHNLEGLKPEYCADCKNKDMINVKNKKCKVCKKKQPTFNHPDKKKAEFCLDCKDNDMIDNKHKKCNKCKKKRPNFNYPDKSIGEYCGDCKKDKMIDVVNKKCCKCGLKHPNFNYPDKSIGEYCGDCKKDKMIDVVNKKCLTTLCDITTVSTQEKYKGYCFKCFSFNFPYEPIVRSFKKHEYFVKEKLIENNVKFIHNKRINIDDRLWYYPDFVINKNTYIIIVEVDEKCHSRYDKQKEQERMEYLKKQFDKPVLFIRYNPDNKKSDVNVLIKTINEDHTTFETIYLFFNKIN